MVFTNYLDIIYILRWFQPNSYNVTTSLQIHGTNSCFINLICFLLSRIIQQLVNGIIAPTAMPNIGVGPWWVLNVMHWNCGVNQNRWETNHVSVAALLEWIIQGTTAEASQNKQNNELKCAVKSNLRLPRYHFSAAEVHDCPLLAFYTFKYTFSS